MGLTNYPACKSLILLVSGYNLNVRGSNRRPATKSLIINAIFLPFYIIFFLSDSEVFISIIIKYIFYFRNLMTLVWAFFKYKISYIFNQFFDTRTDTYQQMLLGLPLHTCAIYPGCRGQTGDYCSA